MNYLAYVVLPGASPLLYLSFRNLKITRMSADLPTSNIASAGQGLVELKALIQADTKSLLRPRWLILLVSGIGMKNSSVQGMAGEFYVE